MTRAVRYENVHKKFAFNELHTKFLATLIDCSMSEYLGGMRNKNLYDLAFHAAFVLMLQEKDVTTKKAKSPVTKPQTTHCKTWPTHMSDEFCSHIKSSSSIRALQETSG